MNMTGSEQVGSEAHAALEAELPQAWEEIEEGRYQPRRVRGSCVGRELG
jgi:hypothetical protein